jgi:hypothetical protein
MDEGTPNPIVVEWPQMIGVVLLLGLVAGLALFVVRQGKRRTR